MKVLVGCEESQAVCKAFRALGHEAYSCDLQECSGGRPEWHLQMDVFEAIKLKNWDIGIFHPTCTYIANSGVRWLYTKNGEINKERWSNMKEGATFFKKLMEAPIPLIAIENPIPHKYALQIMGVTYTQIIQPYMFGHTESKATCLWLKGLPRLVNTDNVKSVWETLPKREAQRLHYLPPSKERGKIRSKTFEGIARAMAEQWGTIK